MLRVGHERVTPRRLPVVTDSCFVWPMRWLALGLMACGVSSVDVGTRRDEVLGGSAAATESRVFLLDVRGSGASICSAVLVTPLALLTAAHCVDPARHGSPLTVRALNKPDTSSLTMADTTLVSSIRRHPMWNNSMSESPYDIAVIALATPITTVTPATMVGALPSGLMGRQVQVVGYGRTAESMPSSSGTRRAAAMTVTSIDSRTISFGNSSLGLCVGDSGGPSFFNGEVVGIHSRANGDVCGSGIDMRVDVNRAFIDQALRELDPPSCVADGRCPATCGAADPDCCAGDGTCDASCGDVDADCRCASNGTCGASCGAIDEDCCTRDGQCDSVCGTADPDCVREEPMTTGCTSNAQCSSGSSCVSGKCETVVGGCSSAAELSWLALVVLLKRRSMFR